MEDPNSQLNSRCTFRINWLIGTAGCAQERRKDGSLCRHRPEEEPPARPPSPRPGHGSPGTATIPELPGKEFPSPAAQLRMPSEWGALPWDSITAAGVILENIPCH